MSKRVLIFGITGQDGSTLARQLLHETNKDMYEVCGVIRKTSNPSNFQISDLQASGKLSTRIGDVTDLSSVYDAIRHHVPDYIYNFADQDAVDASSYAPLYQTNVGMVGTQNVLQAVRMACLGHVRVFIPSSATVFGHSDDLLTERHKFKPSSPYAIAKAGALHTAEYYRERHSMFVSVGIMFNHVSPTRSIKYLAPKIAAHAVAYHLGKIEGFKCYNPDLRVDIGWAQEYTIAAKMMLEAEYPNTYVVGTGNSYSIRDLWECALSTIYRSSSSDEIHSRANESLIEVDSVEPPNTLIADPRLIQHELGWKAQTDACYVVPKLTKTYLTNPMYNHAISKEFS